MTEKKSKDGKWKKYLILDQDIILFSEEQKKTLLKRVQQLLLFDKNIMRNETALEYYELRQKLKIIKEEIKSIVDNSPQIPSQEY